MFVTIIHILGGPVIGAIIGAFTNYIAIKMLFRPLKEKRIGRFKVPFTPGVIPKHQEELAGALSKTVYQNFFTNNDIEGIFLSEEMEALFVDKLYYLLCDIELSKLSEALDEDAKLKIKESVYNKIHNAILHSNISGVVADQTEKIIRSKVKGGSLAGRLLNDNITSRLSTLIGNEVASYIREHDLEILLPILEQQKEELKEANTGKILQDIGADKEKVCAILKHGYRSFMANAKETIAETFHIKDFIYQKIMNLNPSDIERLVNEAIKREMNYLVYLGALLGFLIGIINIFI